MHAEGRIYKGHTSYLTTHSSLHKILNLSSNYEKVHLKGATEPNSGTSRVFIPYLVIFGGRCLVLVLPYKSYTIIFLQGEYR